MPKNGPHKLHPTHIYISIMFFSLHTYTSYIHTHTHIHLTWIYMYIHTYNTYLYLCLALLGLSFSPSLSHFCLRSLSCLPLSLSLSVSLSPHLSIHIPQRLLVPISPMLQEWPISPASRTKGLMACSPQTWQLSPSTEALPLGA